MELRAIITFTFGLILLVSTKWISSTFAPYYNPENFLSFHTLIELLCISISLSIFIQGWLVFPHTLSRKRVVLAILFFIMSVLDILHTLSYKGMPFFFLESSAQRATWLWILSRIILSFGLLVAIYQKDKEVTRNSRLGLFSAAVFLVAVIGLSVFLMEHRLPMLIQPGVGPTGLKISLEYLISFVFLLTIALLFHHYMETKNIVLLHYLLALSFSLFSELMFTIYKDVYDLDNFIGHLLKLIGYYFFMKGIFISTIHLPFLKEKESKLRLEKNERQLGTILSMIPTGITITDPYGKTEYANKAAEQMLHLSNDEMMNRNVTHPDWNLKTLEGEDFPEQNHVFYTVTRTKQSVYDVRCVLNVEEGKKVVLSVNAAPIINEYGEIERIVNTLTDITEKVEAEKEIHSLAYEDELTGLPNRYAFIEKISTLSDKTSSLMLLLININRFKNVNDSLGTEIGDLVLKEIAERLRTFDIDAKFIARIGADEFGLLVYQKTYMSEYAKRLVKTLENPIISKELKFHITISVGVSGYESSQCSGEELLKQANIALAEAKRSELTFLFYNPGMGHVLNEKVEMENDLRRAIEQRELLLYFQPQVLTENRQIVGVEALVRWMHPKNGIVAPGKFIPLAEETGLIVPIGKWVIEEACRQMKEWVDKGFPPMKISVNLSFRQFFQEDLIEIVSNALSDSGLDPHLLELEITESMTIHVEKAIKILTQLKELGVSIAVDDFGTGYSSLSYLYQYPIDLLKIDQSFVRNIRNDKNYEILLETIIMMAKQLKLELIAEGVETEEQVNFLKEKKCDKIQGYLISKPLDSEGFELFLEKVCMKSVSSRGVR
jgi:diguanylate cyclase (GGDEF)-like protein/PAS domain S-box-containing protein